MRIAYVSTDPGVPVFGCKGCSVHVQEVIRAFRRAGADVHLFARRFGGEAPADLVDLNCTPLEPVAFQDPALREAGLRAADARLPALFEASGPFDLVYERHALWSSSAMDWARRRGIAALLEVNAPLVDEQAEHRVLFDRATAERIADAAFRSADRIVAVSSGVARHVEARGVHGSSVTVIGNGVDPRRFGALRAATDGPITVGFVGTLKPWHGLDILIDAVREARALGADIRLLIVGDGPGRGAIEQHLYRAGLSAHADLTGAVAPVAIPDHLARIDIAVAPYPDIPDFYFSPLKVVEYMAAGSAVVASRIGDIDGLVTDGVDGLLVEAGSSCALARAIALLVADPALRRRLGKAARKKAAVDCSWDAVAGKILGLAAERLPC